MSIPVELIDRGFRMSDEEVADEAASVCDALLTLLEGRPSLVAADACLRAVAELIVTELDEGTTTEQALTSASRVLRAYVEGIQNDLAASHSHRP